ncbi:hypothetical protein PILCRDRAFT_6975 [Piloderma croceum F 1598]|uniref:Uncharacterized protein n=1 Tax=Piloderma croceum (strain F 1598) TaxID=765440 RepID=A0A0C3C1T1_PILCF|nr:hypothetical protein PILCRDRAFT_6975 [Piloderma croceum F 1598]
MLWPFVAIAESRYKRVETDDMKVKEPPPERPSLVAVVGVAVLNLDNSDPSACVTTFSIPPSPSTAKSERQPAQQLNVTRKAHENDSAVLIPVVFVFIAVSSVQASLNKFDNEHLEPSSRAAGKRGGSESTVLLPADWVRGEWVLHWPVLLLQMCKRGLDFVQFASAGRLGVERHPEECSTGDCRCLKCECKCECESASMRMRELLNHASSPNTPTCPLGSSFSPSPPHSHVPP